jgi:hypothetical protein
MKPETYKNLNEIQSESQSNVLDGAGPRVATALKAFILI